MGLYQAGVFRPYNLIDVLGVLNQQSSSFLGGTQTVSTLGAFAEADETLGAIDSVVATVTTGSAQWDTNDNWGNFSWT